MTSAKPFRGKIGENQVRAIRSWLSASPQSDVFIYGHADGLELVGNLEKVHVVSNVECTESGIPYFGSIVTHAATHARNRFCAYVNCDIILSKSIIPVLGLVSFPKFLLVGQRIDLPAECLIDVQSGSWWSELKDVVRGGRATLHDTAGMDYFVFPKGMWENLPPLVVGRGGYDTALAVYCLRRSIPIIDGTKAVLALHQYHGYDHVQGGESQVFYGRDAEQNRRSYSIRHSGPSVYDASWSVQEQRMVNTKCRGDRLRNLEIHVRYVWRLGPIWIVLRALWRILVKLRLLKPKKLTTIEVVDAVERFHEMHRPHEA